MLLTDLLEIEDRHAFGWSVMFTEVRAIVEQLFLVHSAYFYGCMFSSYSGRVANMRTDRQTTFLDVDDWIEPESNFPHSISSVTY